MEIRRQGTAVRALVYQEVEILARCNRVFRIEDASWTTRSSDARGS